MPQIVLTMGYTSHIISLGIADEPQVERRQACYTRLPDDVAIFLTKGKAAVRRCSAKHVPQGLQYVK